MKATSRRIYPWLISLLTTLGIIALILATFLIYNRVSDDQAPDSLAGLAYAIAGIIFMGLATLGYTIARRSHKRRIGTLNTALHWHISFGIIALLLLFLHSFGNFNLRSGTYALCGIVVLVISGMIGRGLDRFVPKLIAQEANRALTEQGEDRIELLTQTLQDIMTHHKKRVESFESPSDVLIPERASGSVGTDIQVSEQEQATVTNISSNSTDSSQPTEALANLDTLLIKKLADGGNIRLSEKKKETDIAHSTERGTITLPTSWDLAYISLAESTQEIERDAEHYRVGLDRESLLHEPEGLITDLQKNMTELHSVQRALQRERFYRAVIRYWRFLHVCLALVTIGLTLWHLEFAATLMFPIYFH